ncbi:MAG: 4-hydroxyphenylpyruvate dioxygenase [Casimicrobiaceae bacterium]|nr:4-hydroxyphenylpyruvate dioxygenase [Casimicrobiaceae bacterium]MCX8098114.1 4-hydroxyphenylpyruvate dioxygenase [Casimicrobiaceae bacterium]MDW8311652.1 4-hydroxyphenylpyruvate dioxygenase [Burkholderiales bacterium]
MHGSEREGIPETPNPLGLEGIEFIEFSTNRPQSLALALERLGFRAIAHHRSREATLFRQAQMNLVIQADPEALGDAPRYEITAVAFRVEDAAQALARCERLGGWALTSRAQAMELVIPSIRGPAGARFFFVDRGREFSVFDIDFRPIPGTDPTVPAVAGTRFFGVVQYIAAGRYADWIHFYERLFGWKPIPDELRFGVLPRGKILASPGGQFFWQLIAPEGRSSEYPVSEALHRVAFASSDVLASVAALRARGVQFVETPSFPLHERGALTHALVGDLAFELVHEPQG